jgi:hypothetical protein
MVTTYKLVERAILLQPVLEALVNDAEYERQAQAALKSYNTQAKEGNRVPCNASGMLLDKIKIAIKDPTTWEQAKHFIKASQAALYLHRLVDSNLPVLGKVYYSCALIAKQLRLLFPEWPAIEEMKDIFDRRWARWHHPIHTAAYAVDPSYSTHELTVQEMDDVRSTFKVLSPSNWTDVLVQLNAFRTQHHLFTTEEWETADRVHGFQWWDTFGSTLPVLQPIAVQLLARTVSASPCEFNWSRVALHESQRRLRLHTANTNKEVNVAATHQLEASTKVQDSSGMILQLPTLDGAISELAEQVEDEAPLGLLQSLEEVFAPAPNTNTDSASASEDSDESNDEVYKDWDSRLNDDL